MKRLVLAIIGVAVSLSVMAQGKITIDSIRSNRISQITDAMDENDPAVSQMIEQFVADYGVTSDALMLQGLMQCNDSDLEVGLATLYRALESMTPADQINRESILLTLAGLTYNRNDKLEYISQALKIKPKLAYAYALRARVYFDDDIMMDQAVKDAKKAIKYSGGNPKYRCLLVRILCSEGKYKQARKEVNRVISEYDGYAEGYYLRSLIERFEGDYKAQIDDYLVYLQLTHYDRMSIVANTPKEYHGYMLDFAEQILKHAMDRESKGYWNFVVGTIKYADDDTTFVGNVDAALELAESVPVRAQCTMMKSVYYQEREMLDSALALNEVAIALIRQSGNEPARWLLRQRANMLKQQGSYSEADSVYGECIRMGVSGDDEEEIEASMGEMAQAYYFRAQLRLHNLNDTIGAMADLDSAVTYEGEFCPFIYARARLMERTGRASLAPAEYEKIVKLDTTVEIDSYRHFALAKLGRMAEAEAWLKLVMDSASNENLKWMVMYNAACMYAITGDAKMAARYLMDTMEVAPIECGQLRNDEDFDLIRETPEFKAVLKISCSD